jgi:hypothetical protein
MVNDMVKDTDKDTDRQGHEQGLRVTHHSANSNGAINCKRRFQTRTMTCRFLKVIVSHERGWAKSAENVGASPFKSDLSIDTTFSQAHLAVVVQR